MLSCVWRSMAKYIVLLVVLLSVIYCTVGVPVVQDFVVAIDNRIDNKYDPVETNSLMQSNADTRIVNDPDQPAKSTTDLITVQEFDEEKAQRLLDELHYPVYVRYISGRHLVKPGPDIFDTPEQREAAREAIRAAYL